MPWSQMPQKMPFLKVSSEIQNSLIGFLVFQRITFRETNLHSFKKKLDYFILIFPFVVT
jgi:hypothetical protein